MKKGYSVEINISNDVECVLVQNTNYDNCVSNHYLDLETAYTYISLETVIGVWKIKNKN